MISFKEYVNEIKSRFSDDFKPDIKKVNQNLVFDLCGKQIEFKPENEINSDGTPHFTYEEAIACQKDGWRLPTYLEFENLRRKYNYKFNKIAGEGIFEERLHLFADGFRRGNGEIDFVRTAGFYWTSTPVEGSRHSWYLYFNFGKVTDMNQSKWRDGQSVRLVREV